MPVGYGDLLGIFSLIPVLATAPSGMCHQVGFIPITALAGVPSKCIFLLESVGGVTEGRIANCISG